jgi:hypothetical protein
MKSIIYEWLYDTWHAFWYRLIYKSERIGNYRKEINRFTGKHSVYQVALLARLGVDFSKQQVDFINALLKDERTHEAQELVLQEITKSPMNFDGLGEAFIKAAQEEEYILYRRQLPSYELDFYPITISELIWHVTSTIEQIGFDMELNGDFNKHIVDMRFWTENNHCDTETMIEIKIKKEI